MEVGEKIRLAAVAEGMTVSRWLTRAASLVADQEAALRGQDAGPQIFSGVSEISQKSIARPAPVSVDRRPFRPDFKKGKK